jgi:nitrate reductase gamma subunit
MEMLLEFAKGPLFTATFVFMCLGLVRLVVLQLLEMLRAWTLTQDHDIPIIKNLKEFMTWTVPNGNMLRMRPFFSIASIIFHIGLILVPIFYLGHVVLWESGLGISWPGFFRPLGDVLTATTVISGLVLLGYRLFHKSFRNLSSAMDYFLLILILAIFLSGFLAAHPVLLPINYTSMMLIHVVSAEIIFILMPFTKLSHMILFPFGRISSDYYWKLSTDGPEKVAHIMRGDDLKA